MKKRIILLVLAIRRLNNAEFGSFMDKFIQLILKLTIEKLGIVAETFNALREKWQKLSDLVVKQRSSKQTAKLKQLDKERDKHLSYLLSEVRAKLKSYNAAHKSAAETLLPLVKNCSSMQQLPNEQESNTIDAFLLDARKPDFAEAFALLGLADAIAELDSINASYKQLNAERSEARIADTTESSATVRAQMKELYDDILAQAYATYVHSLSDENPDPEPLAFVEGFNQIVSETLAAYKLRSPQRKSSKK